MTYLEGNFSHELVDLPDNESFTIDGRRWYRTFTGIYASVTTILGHQIKDGIKAWETRVGLEEAARVKYRATTQGQAVHDMCEDYVAGRPIDVNKSNPVYVMLFKSLKPILDERLTRVKAMEVALSSQFLQCAGRVDLVGYWDGVLSVIDYKTSRREKKEEWIDDYYRQESAYAVCWEELTGTPIQQIVTVVANVTAPPQVFIDKRDNWIHSFIARKNDFYGDVSVPSV